MNGIRLRLMRKKSGRRCDCREVVQWTRSESGEATVFFGSATLNWRGAVSPTSAGFLRSLGFTGHDFKILSCRTPDGSQAIWRMFRDYGGCYSVGSPAGGDVRGEPGNAPVVEPSSDITLPLRWVARLLCCVPRVWWRVLDCPPWLGLLRTENLPTFGNNIRMFSRWQTFYNIWIYTMIAILVMTERRFWGHCSKIKTHESTQEKSRWQRRIMMPYQD